MEFFKHIWGYLLAVALVLIAGGVIWYFLFCGVPRDYAGGILVFQSNKNTEVQKSVEETGFHNTDKLSSCLIHAAKGII